jgi:Spy/CpxP family protein refolding chaperone
LTNLHSLGFNWYYFKPTNIYRCQKHKLKKGEEMKTSKYFIIVLSILLLGSSALTFAQGKMMGPNKSHFDLFKQLKLTPDQKTKTDQLNYTFRKDMINLKADLQKNMLDLNEVRKQENFTRNDMISALEKVNKSRDQIALARMNHHMDIYDLLDQNQKQIWRENGPRMGIHQPMNGRHFRNDMRMRMRDGMRNDMGGGMMNQNKF